MKIYSRLENLNEKIESIKQKGARVVLANGCFDLIHVGHLRYLEEAKQKGDILVVAINSDHSVRALKGPGRPLMNQDERALIVSSFRCVDFVLIFDEFNVSKILESLKPDIHAKGSDYTPDTVPERQTVLSYGGKIAITGGPKVRSTSDIIRDIRTMSGGSGQ